MRRPLSFLAVLIVGVLTSACVNTFAIHELNQLAANYIEKGDVASGISRLESSIDLDENIYETRYNLAVAYLKVDNCQKALENIKKAKELSPKEPSVYYTLGVSYNCEADRIKNQKCETPEERELYNNYLQEANNAYEKYIALAPESEDIEQVKEQIQSNNQSLAKELE